MQSTIETLKDPPGKTAPLTMPVKVAFDLPRLKSHPHGLQLYLEQTIKSIIDVAPPREWNFSIQASGLQGKTEHLQRVQLIDEHGRSQQRWINIPESVLSATIPAIGIPNGKMLFGDASIVHTAGFSWVPKDCAPVVLSLLDVIAITCNEDPEWRETILKRTKYLVNRATRIITISEFSRREIIEVCDADPEKVKVVLASADHAIYRQPTQPEREANERLVARLGLREPYLMCFCGPPARKNIKRLLVAFELLKERHQVPHQLVIAGQQHFSPELSEQLHAMKHATDVINPGYLERSELVGLLQSAECLVFPSYYEGFGLPPLEAMACGVPVVVSNAASIPEVVGESGLYFDPYSEDDICESIYRMLSDANLRKECSDKGLERSRQFDWNTRALDILQIYKSVLGL